MHLKILRKGMNYRSFEHQIASTLRSAEEPIDTDLLIASLHSSDRDRTRPVFIWWLMGAGLLIGLLGFGLLTSSEKPEALKAATLPAQGAEVSELSEVSETAYNQPVTPDDHQTAHTGKESASNVSSLREATSQSAKGNKIFIPSKEAMGTTENIQSAAISGESSSVSQRESMARPEELSSVTIRPELKTAALPGPKYGKIVCPDFSNRSKPYLEIIPEVGAFLPLKRLEQGGNEASNIYALRNKNEKSLEGLNAGLYVRLRKEKLPFYLAAGISYSRLTEKMNLNYSYTRKDTTQGIISITVSQTGDTITTIYGDIITEKKISGYKVRHHNLSLVDLPVALGFEKQAGDWTLGAEGGLALNLRLGSGGQLLASDTSFVRTDAAPRPFKSGVGLSYFGGLLAGRSLGNGHRVYLAARFRYLPQTFSSDNNVVRQGYSFAGLYAGYVIRF